MSSSWIGLMCLAVLFFWGIAFTAFIPTANVLAQTINNIIYNTTFFLFAYSLSFQALQYRYFRIVLLWYFAANIALALHNYILYPTWNDWLTYSNSNILTAPYLSLIVLGSLIHGLRDEGKWGSI